MVICVNNVFLTRHYLTHVIMNRGKIIQIMRDLRNCKVKFGNLLHIIMNYLHKTMIVN